ncbi:DUF6455 family protein [Dongia sp.]|uniref:DUF6455 family protein n=1 Tax=Dongia sp. TaxID=1977262 RepID=UPI0035B418AB
METRKIPSGRISSGGSLGALLVLLDLTPETVAAKCGAERLRGAMGNCLGCRTHGACASWMAGARSSEDAWHSFCPNTMTLVESLRRRKKKRP